MQNVIIHFFCVLFIDAKIKSCIHCFLVIICENLGYNEVKQKLSLEWRQAGIVFPWSFIFRFKMKSQIIETLVSL